VIGVDRPEDFDYLTPPSLDTIKKALETLVALGCLKVMRKEGRTPCGSSSSSSSSSGSDIRSSSSSAEGRWMS